MRLDDDMTPTWQQAYVYAQTLADPEQFLDAFFETCDDIHSDVSITAAAVAMRVECVLTGQELRFRFPLEPPHIVADDEFVAECYRLVLATLIATGFITSDDATLSASSQHSEVVPTQHALYA